MMGKRITAAALTVLALGGLTRAGLAQAPPAAPAGNKVAAVVNGEGIPANDLDRLLRRDTPPVHPQTAGQKDEMRRMALNMLIDDLLMRQFLRKNVAPVGEAAVAKELAELEAALVKQKKTVADFLKESGQTSDELKADVAARLQWKNWLAAKLPDATVKQYYDANKVFFDKVFVKASHILIRVDPKATDADRQAARTKLANLRADILAGKADFAQAAKANSDCPSKINGGDIGHFPYKFAVQESFARAAFALQKGQLSDIVQTDFGFHIILVTDRTQGEPSNYDNIKEMVRDVYAQELELYQGVIAEQRKTARIEMMPQ
jgi:peptidyl-prolyl cis-trans isomerase C